MLAGLMAARAAQIWAERAQSELGAARRFRELAVELEAVGVHARILERVGRAVGEEEEHALLCARMARELGHETGFALPEGLVMVAPPSWHGRPDRRERVLLDVVSMCCITESFNASLLRTLYQQSPPGPTRSVLHRILRDEVQHAQIGWGLLGSEQQRVGCSFVADFLPEMLDRSVRDGVFLPVVDRGPEEADNRGVLPVAQRRAHFYSTLDTVIVPGFAHVGIDTAALTGWRDRKLQLHRSEV